MLHYGPPDDFEDEDEDEDDGYEPGRLDSQDHLLDPDQDADGDDLMIEDEDEDEDAYDDD